MTNTYRRPLQPYGETSFFFVLGWADRIEYTTKLVSLPQASASLAAMALHVPLIGDIAPFKELGIKGLAAIVIVLLTIVNYVGVRFGGLVQNIFSIAKMSAMIGILVVAAMYLLMSATYSYVLPIDEMARGGMLPALLGRAHPRFHTPGASLVAQAVWSVLLLFSGTFDALTDTLIFVSWFFYAANAWAVIILRRREPAAPRPFKVPGYPLVPVLFVAFGLVYLVLTIWNDLTAYRKAAAAGQPAFMNCALGAALVLSGTPIYAYYRWRSRERVRARAGISAMEKTDS